MWQLCGFYWCCSKGPFSVELGRRESKKVEMEPLVFSEMLESDIKGKAVYLSWFPAHVILTIHITKTLKRHHTQNFSTKTLFQRMINIYTICKQTQIPYFCNSVMLLVVSMSLILYFRKNKCHHIKNVHWCPLICNSIFHNFSHLSLPTVFESIKWTILEIICFNNCYYSIILLCFIIN